MGVINDFILNVHFLHHAKMPGVVSTKKVSAGLEIKCEVSRLTFRQHLHTRNFKRFHPSNDLINVHTRLDAGNMHVVAEAFFRIFRHVNRHRMRAGGQRALDVKFKV